jgi:hypothetical protein
VYSVAVNPFNGQHNVMFNDTRKKVITTYLNPGDPTPDSFGQVDGFAACGYGANFYVFGHTCCEDCLNPTPLIWDQMPTLESSFPDGTANTILITEKYARCGIGGSRWAEPFGNMFAPMYLPFEGKLYQVRPTPENCDWRIASTPFANISAAFGDGSARPINPNIKPMAWRALCTTKGGEVIDE